MHTGSNSETKTDNNDEEYEEYDENSNNEIDEEDDAEVEIVTLGQTSSQESTTPESTRRSSPQYLKNRVTPRDAENNVTPQNLQLCSSSSSYSKKRNASRFPWDKNM